MTFVTLILAVFFAWEFVLPLIPQKTPPQVHPLLVAGLGFGALYVPRQVILALAVAGAVGILHAVVRLSGSSAAPLQIRIPRRSKASLPRGVGSRIPTLP